MAKYSASDIDVLKGLEPVRAKPGMYIGGTDQRGVYHAGKEVIDNFFDETEASGNYTGGVAISKDKTAMTVWDNGRGIPVEKHKKTGVSTLETIFTTLHAGGKLSATGNAYKGGSRGTHGVGASVTNALSRSFKVWTVRDGTTYYQEYKRGVPQTKVKATSVQKRPNGEKHKKGTMIEFVLDDKIFKNIKHPEDDIKAMIDLTSYLYPKLEVTYIGSDGKTKVYNQPKGLKKLLKKEFERLGVGSIGDEPFEIHEPGVDLIMQWSGHSSEELTSYVVGSKTSDGGAHVRGLYKAISKAIEPHLGKKDDFSPTDLRTGLLGILNFTVRAPAFEGQTKHRLANADHYDATDMVFNAVHGPLVKWFKKNPDTVRDLIERANEIRKATNSAKLSKEAASALRTKKQGKMLLPSKLAPSLTRKDSERELYIVEGDSAAGECKKARNKHYQEVLPLSGKPPNVYKDGSKAFTNERIIDILKSIGFDPKAEKPESKLRVGKIIIMADADEDGKHITVLILEILMMLVPKVFDKGMVYTVDPLLFNAQHKGKRVFAESLKALEKLIPGLSPNSVQRVKGYGEIKAPVIGPIAFHPETRQLSHITTSSTKDFVRASRLVGEDVQARRDLLGI